MIFDRARHNDNIRLFQVFIVKPGEIVLLGAGVVIPAATATHAPFFHIDIVDVIGDFITLKKRPLIPIFCILYNAA